MGTLGGLAHATLGHRWTVEPMKPESLQSDQFSGAQNQALLMWFWHIGSAVLISASGLFLLQGLNLVLLSQDLLIYLSFLWLSVTAIFLIVCSVLSVRLTSIVPGLVGIPINALLLLGLFA